jgi:hypothetical protein
VHHGGDLPGDLPAKSGADQEAAMSLTSRTWISATLGVLAFVLYAADLLGLKPPPRILPSVVLAIAAVVIGVAPRRTRRTDPADTPATTDAGSTSLTDRGGSTDDVGRPRPAGAADAGVARHSTGPALPASAMSPGDRVMTITGFVLLVALLVPVVPIGLVAPGLGIITIHGIWLIGFIAAWRLRRSNPPAVLAIPFVAAALIAATLWFGTTVLGWRP